MMNTTVASYVKNITPFSPQDSNHENHSLDTYTIVLSVTVHLTSMLFGGASSTLLITAILTKRNINKQSYLPVLALTFACCCFNLIFSPMEITDLLMFHLDKQHPIHDFFIAKTVVYIFLTTIISVVIFMLILESMIRKTNSSSRILQTIWPHVVISIALLCSVVHVVIVLSQMEKNDCDSPVHIYTNTNSECRETFSVVIIILYSLIALVILALFLQFLKSRTYWEGCRPHFREKKSSLAVPEFLISQSQNDCEEEDETGGYDNVNEPSSSRTPSPSTPKLLSVSSPDSGSIKSSEGMPAVHGMPKSSGNRLGINMAQVLGRRRHTICDTIGATPAPSDPLTKAKQYNYVRKFSVDISALQAQLQNPKIFKDAPFQSDVDLTKRVADDNKAKQKPLQPLKPLDLKLKDTRVNSMKEDSVEKTDTPRSAGLSIPPPVIMVSNDDTISEKDDNNKDIEETAVYRTTSNTSTGEININVYNNHQSEAQRPQVPSTLSLIKSDNIDDIASMPTLESAVSAQSDTAVNNKLSQLAAMVGLTFLIAMMPVLLTEALRYDMTSHSFVDISTNMLAISTLQTIVYPYLLTGYDEVLRSAIRKLKRRWFCMNDDNNANHCKGRSSHKFADESSSTSHV